MDTEETRAARRAISLGHEPTDVNVRGVFIFGGSLLAALVIVLGVVALAFAGFRHFSQRWAAQDSDQELAAHSLVRVSPRYEGPLLQVKPEEDLRWMKTYEAGQLQTYGWVDQPAGIVRLPIDRAMDLLVERGLPPVSPGLTIEALQRQRADPQVRGQALRP